MANQTTPSRSFNTVKSSNRQARRARKQTSRVILLAIFAVVAALVLSCFVFIVCSIVNTLRGDAPNDGKTPPVSTSGTPNGDAAQPVVYQSLTQSNFDVHKGILVIVNETYAYEFPASGTGLKKIMENRLLYNDTSNTFMVNGNNSSWMLEEVALDALNQMMLKHYELFEDGSVSVSSAYRTEADQAALGSSIQPGHSDHHTGLCVALMTYGQGPLESSHWVYNNCYKYGFIVRYPDVKEEITGVSNYTHCFRYVGIPHATYINNNNLCMEEYVQLLQGYTKDAPLAITGADGHRYEVYYTAASNGDITTIQVPQNYVYTVSGDNIGGFIVTVHLDEPANA